MPLYNSNYMIEKLLAKMYYHNNKQIQNEK